MTPVSKAAKRNRARPHPYLSGNFAPVHKTVPLTPCVYTGAIPDELVGGEYVRNGGNPVSNEDLGRDAHWFDGDGMLSGVAFTRTTNGVQPEFVNQYVLTDIFLSTIASQRLRTPLLPSIATLVNPLSPLYKIIVLVFRAIFFVILSWLPGSVQVIKKISVANTAIIFHDGRALATCESGPPMRVSLPSLETIGWYNGKRAEGEPGGEQGPGFGGEGILGFMREWTTAHPRVDSRTGELILFHATFAPPYVHYSIIPSTHKPIVSTTPLERPTRLLNAPIPGITSAKMMHDFGVSFNHTIIMDLPLSLDPLNLAKNTPVVAYDPMSKSRFGIFPRNSPELIRWFETKACCIFHTANTWDDQVTNKETGRVDTISVNMLASRLTSASLVFSAGNIAVPQPTTLNGTDEEDQCRLYYYQFGMDDFKCNRINYQFALSAIPFEFPSVNEEYVMGRVRYIYGCSTSEGSFGAALGRAVKIDCLVKIDAETLISRGKKDPSLVSVTGCVDKRSLSDIISSGNTRDDPVSVFKLPQGWYAQEPRFVARHNGESEDDGWLLTYVFDESQLDAEGECRPDAISELWIIDARDMTTIVARIQLTQRVTYGLHGSFITEDQIKTQRPIETIRGIKELDHLRSEAGLWSRVRQSVERLLA
ncbi:hypothetical protein PV08_05310 [Exophiala spinifera]|uniref:Carotenoid oxygenase n=1 Tax=Exophiala spinifera TaxID=91928 RepID=A0A0D2B9D2_9EURO|nr:uncharacterized protein PV08_05310 [Exophiala spinifera]KIW15265.1 hypothetical protein PV08_05310 [Exophiala spinifera]